MKQQKRFMKLLCFILALAICIPAISVFASANTEVGYYASSMWNAAYAASYAFDNDTTTAWAAKPWASKGTEYIYTMFDEYVDIDAVELVEKGRRIGAFELQYYDMSGAWTTCYTGTLNETCDKTGGLVSHPVISLGTSVTCKGIRLNILGGSDASPGLFEFRMFYAGIQLQNGKIETGYYASGDDGNTADKAFDNDPTTRWSAKAAQDQWLCVLFDNPATIDSVEILEFKDRMNSYELQYYDPSGAWITCASKVIEGADTGKDTTHQLSFDPVTTTGIRLYIYDAPGWPSIYELKMFYEGVQVVDGKLKTGYYASGNDGNTADKAFDNDPTTRWSANAPENQWLCVSYDNKITFDAVTINEFWDRMNSFELQYYDDQGIWQTCASKTLEGEKTQTDTTHQLSFAPVTTSAIRLFIPDAPGWPSIYEIKLSYQGMGLVDGQIEKGYYASGSSGADYAVEKAFDGNEKTQWVTKPWASKGTEWIAKIYDEYVLIDSLEIVGKGNRIGAFEIQYINENGAWTTCYTGVLSETCDKAGGAITHPVISLGKAISCKGIRFNILGGADASPGMYEFKMFYVGIEVKDEKIDFGYYSSTNDGNTADKAFDNDPTTRWSASAAQNQWLCTFFENAVTIDSVELSEFWDRMNSFEIQYIDENGVWKTCASKTVEGEDTGLDTTHQLSFDPVTTTGMRLYIHDAPGWGSIYEFKMFYTGIQVIDGKIPGGYYSSSDFEDCDVSLAFDCKLDTRWSASAEKDQWISAFYDEPITFDAVTINEFWDRMNSFEIQYYGENGIWQTITSKTISGEDTGLDATHSLSFGDITTNGIRVFIPDAPGWPSIYEVQLLDDGFAWIDVQRKPSDYSIAIIPDQQCLTHWHPEQLYGMYQWIADNAEKENMQMVINLGDITNSNTHEHWQRAKNAYDLLPEDLPYIAVPGNHDYAASFRDTSNMNAYFPISLFEQYSTYGGSYTRDNNLPDDVANTWQAFEINGNKYLILALEFGPRDSVLEWASDVVEAHPYHQVIVVTHGLMNSDGTLLEESDNYKPTDYSNMIQDGQELPNNPEAVWEKFVKNHKNIIMTLSGHVGTRNIVMRTDLGVHGNEVKQILIDAQNEHPRLDMVAMMHFSNDGQDVEVTYYSPSKGKYMNYENQFMIHLPKQEETVAQVGEQTYTSVTEAISNANGQVVKLLACSDEAIVTSNDVTIDLAGFSLSNVTVSSGKLQLVDTIGGGSANVAGNVETLTEADGKTYLVVGENGVYSAHEYAVEITHISLDPTNDALGYKAELIGDDVVKSHVTAIGFNLWVDGGKVKTYTKTGTDAVTLRLKNILKAGGGEMNIHATAFVTFAVGEESYTKTTGQQTTTMKETLQAVDSAWETYSQAQKDAVCALCKQYLKITSEWELDNIFGVINIPIA